MASGPEPRRRERPSYAVLGEVLAFISGDGGVSGDILAKLSRPRACVMLRAPRRRFAEGFPAVVGAETTMDTERPSRRTAREGNKAAG